MLQVSAYFPLPEASLNFPRLVKVPLWASAPLTSPSRAWSPCNSLPLALERAPWQTEWGGLGSPQEGAHSAMAVSTRPTQEELHPCWLDKWMDESTSSLPPELRGGGVGNTLSSGPYTVGVQ